MVETLFLRIRAGRRLWLRDLLCSAFLFPGSARFTECAVFVLGSTEFGAQRARVGVELVSCPSPSPVRGHLPLSGPLPVAGETKGWETRSCLIGPSGWPLEQSHPDPGVSPRSRGVTQIPGSHLDPPSLRRLGEVRAGCTRRCVVVEPDPQRAGDLTGLHDGVWGSSAPFHTAQCRAHSLGVSGPAQDTDQCCDRGAGRPEKHLAWASAPRQVEA